MLSPIELVPPPEQVDEGDDPQDERLRRQGGRSRMRLRAAVACPAAYAAERTRSAARSAALRGSPPVAPAELPPARRIAGPGRAAPRASQRACRGASRVSPRARRPARDSARTRPRAPSGPRASPARRGPRGSASARSRRRRSTARAGPFARACTDHRSRSTAPDRAADADELQWALHAASSDDSSGKCL